MLKNILSVVAGLIAAIIIFTVFEKINSLIFPSLTSVDFNNPEVVKNMLVGQPATIFILILMGWAVGSFVCGMIIKLISKSEKEIIIYIPAILLAIGASLNFIMIKHPIWVMVVSTLIFAFCTITGFRKTKTKN